AGARGGAGGRGARGGGLVRGPRALYRARRATGSRRGREPAERVLRDRRGGGGRRAGLGQQVRRRCRTVRVRGATPRRTRRDTRARSSTHVARPAGGGAAGPTRRDRRLWGAGGGRQRGRGPTVRVH